MFEIEKKFRLSTETEKSLLENAEFLGEKSFEDIYFDTDDYSLTKNDKWLRCREGNFEMKIPLPGNNKVCGNQYEELTEEQKIKDDLKLEGNDRLNKILEENNYKPFCKIKTFRQEYKKEGYTIDVDKVDCGDFDYRLVEIESLIDNPEEANEVLKKIIEFGKSFGLKDERLRGKVVQYLKNKKSVHYDALVKCGVVEDY